MVCSGVPFRRERTVILEGLEAYRTSSREVSSSREGDVGNIILL